jgi:FkbM family methyltransferase
VRGHITGTLHITMIDTTYEGSRQRKITNRRGGIIGSSTGSQRHGATIITTQCYNSCRTLCFFIANVTYVIFYVVLGFACGFILLIILYLLSILTPLQIDTSNSNFDVAAKPTTITDALIQQAAQNNKDETNSCVIPLGATVVSIKPSSNDNESFRLVVHNDDFLSSQLISKGFWEIRSLDEMAALSPSLTIPKNSKISAAKTGTTTNVTTTTFYDIGANVGYYSFLFAASGYNVIAFEPEKSNCALFLASMCLNPNLNHRIKLYDYVISDINSDDDPTTKDCKIVGRVNSRTRKYLYSIPRLNCDTNYKCIPDQDLICETNITITTLDHFVNQLHPDVPLPHIIKLDVEGQELKVIESIFTNNNVRLKRADSQQLKRRIEPLLMQYENKDGRYRETISSMLSINGYIIGEKRGHDHNTIAEFQLPKKSKPNK